MTSPRRPSRLFARLDSVPSVEEPEATFTTRDGASRLSEGVWMRHPSVCRKRIIRSQHTIKYLNLILIKQLNFTTNSNELNKKFVIVFLWVGGGPFKRSIS